MMALVLYFLAFVSGVFLLGCVWMIVSVARALARDNPKIWKGPLILLVLVSLTSCAAHQPPLPRPVAAAIVPPRTDVIEVHLEWSQSPNPDALKYILCWGQLNGMDTNNLVTLQMTSAKVNVVPDVGYWYRVAALAENGVEVDSSRTLLAKVPPTWRDTVWAESTASVGGEWVRLGMPVAEINSIPGEPMRLYRLSIERRKDYSP